MVPWRPLGGGAVSLFDRLRKVRRILGLTGLARGHEVGVLVAAVFLADGERCEVYIGLRRVPKEENPDRGGLNIN